MYVQGFQSWDIEISISILDWNNLEIFILKIFSMIRFGFLSECFVFSLINWIY
jgi:hypothetical protein